eukprot:SAG31_NODE_212_length_20157_cov_9.648868_15_plen_183_part_00
MPRNMRLAVLVPLMDLFRAFLPFLYRFHSQSCCCNRCSIAWFDFGNAFYTYYSFFMAAPWSATRPMSGGLTQADLDTLRQQFMTGLRAYFQARSYSVQGEHDALFTTIYRVITRETGLQNSGQQWWMLRRWPWEMISWPATNSHRQDVVLQKDWLACCNESLSTTPIAPDEGPVRAYTAVQI